MAKGSSRVPQARGRNVRLAGGARVIGGRTAAGIGRLRNRAGGLTALADRARANRRRRPSARTR